MSDIVSLNEKRNKKEEGTEVTKVQQKKNEDGYDFEAIMKRNAENDKRLKSDREKNNRGVTRSYRLKH